MNWKKAGTMLALTGAVYFGPAAQACDTLIVWQADLTGTGTPLVTPNMSSSIPTVTAPALGTATVQFDFVNPGATFRVETKKPGEVQQIALHVTRTFSSSTGPTLFTLYSSSDGPLPAVYTKRVADADLQKQPALKILTLSDAVKAVLDGRAYVTVTPKPKPHAPLPVEIAGFITMRKEEIYSNKPGDAQHDPTLHHAAQTLAVTR